MRLTRLNLVPRMVRRSFTIQGQKLSEGDAPARIKVTLKDMEQYAKVWRNVRVYVEDSAGRKYFAKKLSRVPPWAQ